MSKFGVIDVGGGMRDIFGAGVLDGCIQEGISFSYCIGISAGSGNVASFLAGQRKRNYKFYIDYAFRKEYIGFGNFFKTGNYVNLDYAYTTLTRASGEFPLDYPALAKNPAEFYVVACNAKTGEPKYFGRDQLGQDSYDIFKASSCLPVVNQPYMVDGTPYFDGGLADPVPVEKAFADGCDKVVLILSRPKDYIRTPKKDEKFARLIRRKYPEAARGLCHRYEKYNGEIALAREYEAKGRLLFVAPEDCFGVDTLTRDKEKLERLYEAGVNRAGEIKEFLSTGN